MQASATRCQTLERSSANASGDSCLNCRENRYTITYPFSALYAYHANGTVSSAEFYSGGSPHAEKRYQYVFAYDALQRLKSANYSGWNGAWITTPNYDLPWIGYNLSGNVTGLQRNRQDGTLIDNLSYGIGSSSNRLFTIVENAVASAETWDAEAAASGSFTYDGNGNLMAAPDPYFITAVTYDPQNLPLSVTRSGPSTTTYRYAEGQRIAKQKDGGNTEIYVLDGATTLGVVTVDGGGAPSASYFNVIAGDKVVGRQPSGSVNRRYYHTDLLGSTRTVVEGNPAVVVESYDYDPWGLLMPGRTLGGGTKEGFTGKERDLESGLDYFGARYYMAALARWASPDPLGDRYPEWSSYNYVLNNPLSFVDPTGLSCERTGDDRLECSDIEAKDLGQVAEFLGQDAAQGDDRRQSDQRAQDDPSDRLRQLSVVPHPALVRCKPREGEGMDLRRARSRDAGGVDGLYSQGCGRCIGGTSSGWSEPACGNAVYAKGASADASRRLPRLPSGSRQLCWSGKGEHGAGRRWGHAHQGRTRGQLERSRRQICVADRA